MRVNLYNKFELHNVNYNKIIWISGFFALLSGCASTGTQVKPNIPHYNSVQELISKQQLNQANQLAKEYVYDWGLNSGGKSVQSGIPKQNLQAYCQAKNGKFSQLHKSEITLIKESWTKRLLKTYGAVNDNIGAFRCIEQNGQQWIVSVEPVSERKLDNAKDTRVVALLTKVLTATEAQNFYSKRATTTTVAAVTPEKPNQSKPTTAKAEPKVEEKIVEKPVEKPVVETPKVEVKETTQQQQQRLYLEGRRNLNQGGNSLNACNQLERAYGLGSFYNSSGPNIYTEAGVLVAKCLTTVPAYQKKFGNPKARAVSILQGIVKSNNHRVAKSMLEQLK